MKFTEKDIARMNEGREQGKRPYPIVRHCYHCAHYTPPDENGVWHAEDNVSDDDEVYLSDDDDVGLTFTLHARCEDLQPVVHECFNYMMSGGLLH